MMFLVGDDFIQKKISEVTFDLLCYNTGGYRGLATSGPFPLIYLLACKAYWGGMEGCHRSLTYVFS